MSKRLLDIVAVVVLLPLVAPTVAAVAAVFDGRPLFFSQASSSRYGVPFKMMKLRTMSSKSENPATDAVRMTGLETAFSVLRRDGVEATGSVTTPEFERTVSEGRRT